MAGKDGRNRVSDYKKYHKNLDNYYKKRKKKDDHQNNTQHSDSNSR